MIRTTTWTDADTAEAKRIWEQYQRDHDVSHLRGQAAGIDPKTGEVWIGKSAIDIVVDRQSHGLTSLLFFERIGFPTYLRKGGRSR